MTNQRSMLLKLQRKLQSHRHKPWVGAVEVVSSLEEVPPYYQFLMAVGEPPFCREDWCLILCVGRLEYPRLEELLRNGVEELGCEVSDEWVAYHTTYLQTKLKESLC